MRALVIAAVLAPAMAACLDNGAPASPPPTTTAPIAFAELDANGDVAIATGGLQIVTIADPLAIGLAGETTPGYEVVPTSGLWPNAEIGEYRVRALVEGDGAFSIATEKGVAAGSVTSAGLARLVVRPAAYKLDGHSPFSVGVARPEIEVALFDANSRRLVDGSLVIGGGTQTAWDHATLPATAGVYPVQLTADSMPSETLSVTVTGSVDHVEQTIDDDRTCYHAYAGDIEVATTVPNIVTPDPAATNCELSR